MSKRRTARCSVGGRAPRYNPFVPPIVVSPIVVPPIVVPPIVVPPIVVPQIVDPGVPGLPGGGRTLDKKKSLFEELEGLQVQLLKESNLERVAYGTTCDLDVLRTRLEEESKKAQRKTLPPTDLPTVSSSKTVDRVVLDVHKKKKKKKKKTDAIQKRRVFREMYEKLASREGNGLSGDVLELPLDYLFHLVLFRWGHANHLIFFTFPRRHSNDCSCRKFPQVFLHPFIAESIVVRHMHKRPYGYPYFAWNVPPISAAFAAVAGSFLRTAVSTPLHIERNWLQFRPECINKEIRQRSVIRSVVVSFRKVDSSREFECGIHDLSLRDDPIL